MEVLDGMTLKHRIAGRAMEIETVLDLAIQVADRLKAVSGFAAEPVFSFIRSTLERIKNKTC
jgi:hypothetical protein